jgi:hypothetical protein
LAHLGTVPELLNDAPALPDAAALDSIDARIREEAKSTYIETLLRQHSEWARLIAISWSAAITP